MKKKSIKLIKIFHRYFMQEFKNIFFSLVNGILIGNIFNEIGQKT